MFAPKEKARCISYSPRSLFSILVNIGYSNALKEVPRKLDIQLEEIFYEELEKIFKSKNKPETEQTRKRKFMNRIKQKIEDEEIAKHQKLWFST